MIMLMSFYCHGVAFHLMPLMFIFTIQDLAQRVHKETLHQLEHDADREIEELKNQYEDRLGTERDDKVSCLVATA